MIVGLAGVIAGNDGSYPPYGTLISQSCTEVTLYDAFFTEFIGFYNNEAIYADGVGGSYTVNTEGGGACYYPYGFYFAYSQYPFNVSWTGCETSGVFNEAGYWQYSQMADGAGGVITIDEPVYWNYTNGYYIYDNGTYCRIILDHTAAPWYTVDVYATIPYGTKIGVPYWDTGSNMLVQNTADGEGGVFAAMWDNNPPYPLAGTQTAVQTYACGYHNDANAVSWYLCFYTNTTADGLGGNIVTDVLDGYYPSGWAVTASAAITSEYDYSGWYLQTTMGEVYPWRYGYTSADGYGATFTQYLNAPNGTILSPYVEEITYGSGYIYGDGMGGYYFNTSSPP